MKQPATKPCFYVVEGVARGSDTDLIKQCVSRRDTQVSNSMLFATHFRRSIAERINASTGSLAPPPGPSVQLATAEFMREGHYLRHLRRTKRAYAARLDALLECLHLHVNAANIATAGLAALLRLP